VSLFRHLAAVREVGEREAREYFGSAEHTANRAAMKASLLALDADVERRGRL